jgi:hypothetical protein
MPSASAGPDDLASCSPTPSSRARPSRAARSCCSSWRPRTATPRVYATPDEFDLSRGSERNLGFGRGIHYCLGAPLARLTAQVAIGALAGLDLVIADRGPAQGEGMVIRGLARLPVIYAGQATTAG